MIFIGNRLLSLLICRLLRRGELLPLIIDTNYISGCITIEAIYEYSDIICLSSIGSLYHGGH